MSQSLLRPRENAIFEFNSGSWADVDEEVADDGTTVISLNSPLNTDKKALFRTEPPNFFGPISSVVVRARAGITSTAVSMRFAIKTHGNYYYSSYFTPAGGFTNYSNTWNVNPYTGVAWTLAELADLWIGVTGIVTISEGYYLNVTQIYAEVNYTATGSLSEVVLRPSGNGDVQELGASSGQNYQCVDEETANGDTDYVAVDTNYAYEKDTYNLNSANVGNIAYLAIYATTRHNVAAGYFRIILRTSSTNYYSPSTSAPGSYTEFYEVWGFNPATGEAWTQSDIDALQAGIELGNGSSAVYSPRCTQVYVKVFHKLPNAAARPQIIGLTAL